jgi:hypothetical protein
MAISKENLQQNNNSANANSNSPRSSRPSGVSGHMSSRPTEIVDLNSSDDEMKYGRIVKIIKASPKN